MESLRTAWRNCGISVDCLFGMDVVYNGERERRQRKPNGAHYKCESDELLMHFVNMWMHCGCLFHGRATCITTYLH
jgi:hypothetical protein